MTDTKAAELRTDAPDIAGVYETYRRLIGLLAKSQTLTAEQGVELHGALRVIGLTLDYVGLDTQVVRDHAAKTESIQNAPARIQAINEACRAKVIEERALRADIWKATSTLDRESSLALRTKLWAVQSEQKALLAQSSEIVRSQKQLRMLASSNPRLFGPLPTTPLPRPAPVVKRPAAPKNWLVGEVPAHFLEQRARR